MVMASPEQFLEGGNLALDRGRAFFQKTYQWLEKQHGAANVAWPTIQSAESTPHLSVGVVPRVETQNDRRLQPVKLLEVPRAPHFVDKLAGRASEVQRVREQAEAHNRAARAHNRERMRLLAQMAGQGFGRRQSQKERARLEQEAKLEKEKAQQAAYQAEQAVLSKRTLAL